MNRITRQDIDDTLEAINNKAGAATEGWTKQPDGKYKANIGTYVISGAYGGWKLERLVSDGGGVESITHGFISKRELYGKMQAFLAGMIAS